MAFTENKKDANAMLSQSLGEYGNDYLSATQVFPLETHIANIIVLTGSVSIDGVQRAKDREGDQSLKSQGLLADWSGAVIEAPAVVPLNLIEATVTVPTAATYIVYYGE